MNGRNVYFRFALPCCPKCGMDSGRRMAALTNPEQYFVVCEACGFRTRPHPTQSSATYEWNSLGKKKEK